MVSANDNKVKSAVQSHIKYMWRGHGGITAMIGKIDKEKRTWKRTDIACDVVLQIYSPQLGSYSCEWEYEQFLRRLGFTESQWTHSWRDYFGPEALYYRLMVRGMEDLYNEYGKTHSKR